MTQRNRFLREYLNVNKKIPNTKGLVRKTDYNTKITEFESKLPGATGLVTTAALYTLDIENKIPDITNMATKAALNMKATKIKNKIFHTSHFINTQEFNRCKILMQE